MSFTIEELYDEEDPQVKEAIKLASLAHKNDKWGDFPYTTHLALVANEVGDPWGLGLDKDDMTILAWLHDVKEDHPEFAKDVNVLFPDAIASLNLLTRSKNETYEEYIDRLVSFNGDPFVKLKALYIKLCDLDVNNGNNPPDKLKKRYDHARVNVYDAFLDLVNSSSFKPL